MALATGSIIKAWWPVIVVAASGIAGFTTLKGDVAQLQKQQAQQVSDHDVIVRLDTRMGRMEEDVKDIKQDVKDIAKAVK